MALALGLVGQPVQPYLTTGATDYVNSVQKGKEDAIRTEELKTQSQKSALDLLTAQKKVKDSEWVSTNANDLKARADKGDLDAASIARIESAHPELAKKYFETNDAKAKENVNNLMASSLIKLTHSTDANNDAASIRAALKQYGVPLNLSDDATPDELKNALKVAIYGVKAIDQKTKSVDEFGNVVEKNALGEQVGYDRAPVKPTKATPVMVNGSPKTVKVPGTNEVKILMSDGTYSSGGSIPAPPKTESPMTGYQKIKLEGELRDDYRKDSSNFVEISRQAKIIESSLNDDSAAGALASATAFMKMLDPGSVVRESELAMAMKTNGALDRMGNYMNVIQSGQVLTAQQKADFAKLIKAYSKASNEAQRNLNKKYGQISSEYGLDPKRVVVYDVEKDEKDDKGDKKDPYKITKGMSPKYVDYLMAHKQLVEMKDYEGAKILTEMYLKGGAK